MALLYTEFRIFMLEVLLAQDPTHAINSIGAQPLPTTQSPLFSKSVGVLLCLMMMTPTGALSSKRMKALARGKLRHCTTKALSVGFCF